MFQWSDGTVAYYTKHLRLTDLSVCNRRARADKQVFSECHFVDVKHVLCEKQVTPEEMYLSRRDGSKRHSISRSSNSSVPVKHVVCPSGHWTHSFLTCDTQSACWQQRSASDAIGEVTSLCESPLTTLFTCRSDVDRGSYSLVCDGSQDCLDNSDEDFCVYPPCFGSLHFECFNKQVRITCCKDRVAKLSTDPEVGLAWTC